MSCFKTSVAVENSYAKGIQICEKERKEKKKGKGLSRM